MIMKRIKIHKRFILTIRYMQKYQNVTKLLILLQFVII